MTHDDEIWILASILQLKREDVHYATEILATAREEEAFLRMLGQRVITPLSEVLPS